MYYFNLSIIFSLSSSNLTYEFFSGYGKSFVSLIVPSISRNNPFFLYTLGFQSTGVGYMHIIFVNPSSILGILNIFLYLNNAYIGTKSLYSSLLYYFKSLISSLSNTILLYFLCILNSILI